MTTPSSIDLERSTQEAMRLSSLFMQINIVPNLGIFTPSRDQDESSRQRAVRTFQSKTKAATDAFFSFLVQDDLVSWDIKLQALEQTLALIQAARAASDSHQKVPRTNNPDRQRFDDLDLVIDLASSMAKSSWMLQSNPQALSPKSPSLASRKNP